MPSLVTAEKILRGITRHRAEILNHIPRSGNKGIPWPDLFPHDAQKAYYLDPRRFILNYAARRAGKSEITIRKTLTRALLTRRKNSLFYLCAPTHQQAKRIFWHRLKRYCPPRWRAGYPSETELCLRLRNGACITVTGLDKPERIEGDEAVDGVAISEFGNCKPGVWEEHVYPVLSTRGRLGWAIIEGTPEGRNHYYDLYRQAVGEESDIWGVHHWQSADILDSEVIAQAKRQLDPRTYRQEYEGTWETYAGLAYYRLGPENYRETSYDINEPLMLTFDWNVDPGTYIVIQERDGVTQCISDMRQKESNAYRLTEQFCSDWSDHEGEVWVYGDPSGGNRSVSSDSGTTWQIVARILRARFGDRVRMQLHQKDRSETGRINALNTRLKNHSGFVGLQIDPRDCKDLVEDLETVTLAEGGKLSIDKRNPEKTHLSEALAWYVVARYPVQDRAGGFYPLVA